MTNHPAEDSDAERLRPPPSERFAGSSHHLSLRRALADLRAETKEARNGHRQITLFHRSPVTQVLFSFEPGGHLDEHSAHGLVAIHVIEGQLQVRAEGTEHSIAAGELLVLEPDVPHDVRSAGDAAMLLTVHLESS